VVASFVIGQSFAQEEGGDGMGAMQMPEWRKKTQHHADMAKSVGEFTVVSEMFMAPGQPPQKETATSTRKMVKNGLFLQEDFKMHTPGMAFEGRAVAGYDTVRKKFVSIWFDNSSPVPEVSYGQMEDGKLVFNSEGVGFMSGKLEKRRMVCENLGADSFTSSFYIVPAEGEAHMWMRLTYTRKKAD